MERGEAVAAAARSAGVGRHYWERLEGGEVDPDASALLRIQRHFGLATLEELFGDSFPSAQLINDLLP
jgi:predicted transcriptional regulator